MISFLVGLVIGAVIGGFVVKNNQSKAYAELDKAAEWGKEVVEKVEAKATEVKDSVVAEVKADVSKIKDSAKKDL
jgi:F0F1-type ATP synthase membrane subunit b/b'